MPAALGAGAAAGAEPSGASFLRMTFMLLLLLTA
jgi:hypothetical protein